ncbi:uncharacterized protein B0I36DRAFT_359860 [Microdochium trichocladiopsis]|uniref:LysM domain-containing protein n=1 Tax=Microdochium trichocladiopsis TaxID=1682393 RepID=A0A9P8YHX7_9PEZI|nr:uncharacterized protein B0I36DRAFT_359860 [Microdochium trichocladiopsis]KAH7038274.1 hypothetical protein B0I36DRAFT_359860 [Microdochium trichocladiopsis]
MYSIRTLLVASAALLPAVNADVQLLQFNATSGIPSTCLSVLTQTVACTDQLIHVAEVGMPGIKAYFEAGDLQSLCVATCTTALTTWQRRVVGACANVRIPTERGTQRLVAALAEEFVEAYSSACLKDKSGAFCNVVLGKAAGINPIAQNPTATPDPSVGCHTCLLSILQTQLGMPLVATEPVIRSAFSIITSACKASGWTTATPASTAWEIPASTTTSPPTCQGTTVPVSGQTCQQVAMARGISTSRLLTANNLAAGCYQFPTSGNLCIPSSAVCKPYIVKEGDTCVSVAKGLGKSATQVISWNPELGVDCNNLKSLVGSVICTSNPGGTWVNPNPHQPSQSTTARPTDNIGMTPITNLPMPTNVGWNQTIKYADYAPGSRKDCEFYVQGPVLIDWRNDKYTSSCEDVAKAYGVSTDNFKTWNPSLKTNCTLSSQYQYCAVLGYEVADDPTEYCSKYVLAEAGYSCYDMAALNGVEFEQFALWNPSLGDKCADFKPGLAYCVKVWHYRQPGIVSNCNQLVAANNTEWTSNPCQIIETKFGISHARFVAWNPAVQSDCRGLYLGYDYCVSIPGYKPTYTTPSIAAATGASA